MTAAALEATGKDWEWEEPEYLLGRTTRLTQYVDNAWGIQLTPNHVFFSGSVSGAPHKIYRIPRSNNVTLNHHVISTWSEGVMQEPMGMSFDGDGTMYTADYATGKLYAFAVGDAGSGGPPPVEEVAAFDGAFGIAVLSGEDSGLEVTVREDP